MPPTRCVSPSLDTPDTSEAGGSGPYTRLVDDLNSRLAAARPRLARMARRNGATGDEAEDVAQETLLIAWRTLDTLRDPARFDAWLDGICRNVCCHASRHARHEREHRAPEPADGSDTDETLDLLAAHDADPLDALTRRELATLLERALGLLNGAAREAVQLRYLADLPSDEAAARLGLSVKALEARLSRARKHLRAALNGPLRERAVELDLALAPAGEAGWRETSIWCHFCGKARMQGILTHAPDGSGSLSLRCPLCWRDFGVAETTIPSMPSLANVTTFRPALKRVLEHGVAWSSATQRLETTCYRCGRGLPVRTGRIADFPELGLIAPIFATHYSALYECDVCESSGSGAAALAGRTHPLVRRFMLERRRWRIEPDRPVEYQGSPAIRFTLHDLDADERITYFSDPQTLVVRAVFEQ